MIKLNFKIILTGLWIALLFCGAIPVKAQTPSSAFPLIPYPQKLIRGEGSFIINAQTTIVLPVGKKYRQEADLLNQLVQQSLGRPLKFSISAKINTIRLVNDPSVVNAEGYILKITPKQIVLSAKQASGIFRGIETIRQLLPASIEIKQVTPFTKLILPSVQIEDHPAYAWRGMHLDVSRHFFSVAYLKKYIDLLALYKFNKLHLHLTDDQGWRIEIKKYPKLTEEGAWRTFNDQDSLCMSRAKDDPDFTIDPQHIITHDGKVLYGGFYTQQQMKQVIAFAAERHIDIIPEVDMPGHMMAAIINYPFLSCNGGSKWGEFFTTPICPCNENTFTFAENVFSEIFDIFPSKYIHIGGDEVERSAWAQSAECKALMAREGIENTAALQSYFIKRMEKFFNQHGKKLIGWDEILEGGVSPTAIVMYWRSWVPDAPVKAAKNGNDVIMTPGEPLYFDHDPDKSSVYNVYHFNPIPAGLNETQASHIIGAQANLWTERVPSENRADYMVFPRITALAENLWTKQADYQSYLERLTQTYPRLDNLQVHYRLPDLPGLVESNVFTDRATLNVTKPLPTMRIRYTLDGSAPTKNATELTGPITINHSQHIGLAAFMPSGLRGDVYHLNYEQQTMALPVTNINTKPGLTCQYFAGFFKQTTLIRQDKPDGTFNVESILVPKEANAPSFGLRYRGYLDIPTDGIYTFYLTCDDGGVLKIANRLVVDNDGLHSAIEKDGQVALKQGLQPVALDFIEGGGGYTLKLKYSKNGSEPQDIPASWLKH